MLSLWTLFYAVGIDGTATEIATSDSGWEVRAIGDFSGDKKDDIIAFHKETGIVAMWGNGKSSNWSQLGQLDPKDWFVAGAGDYNGDGNPLYEVCLGCVGLGPTH